MDQKHSKLLTRRDFVMQAGAVSGIAAAVTALQGCGGTEVAPKPTANFSIDLTDAKYASLQNVGGAVVVNSIIIIRRSATVYVALSTLCTHASCTVNYSGNTNRLVCPCHGSIFSNTGSVIQGPATTALANYTVTVNSNTLTVNS